jgi:hypothetical protein
VCAKKNTAPADVFDFGQFVSFLFTFCPPAYLAGLSDVKITSTLLTWFVHDMLDFAADISRLQHVRNRKVLSTS